MKKSLLLFSLAFLVQSCFSYRIDTKPNEMVVGKYYKIKTRHETFKASIKSINDSAVVVKTTKFEEKEIPLNDITKARKRKFSIVKTIGYPVAATAILVAGFALTYDGPTVNVGSSN